MGKDYSCFRAYFLLYCIESGSDLSSAPAMAKIDKTRYLKERDYHKQKKLAIHDIPFGYFSERLSRRKYTKIMYPKPFLLSAFTRDSTPKGKSR